MQSRAPRLHRTILLLAGLMTASLALLLCAERLTRLLDARTVEILVAASTVLQLGAAMAIACTASPPHRLLVAAGAVVAALWALLCGFLGIMASSGNWM